MTTTNILAQIINFMGCIFNMIGINIKNKSKILLFFIIGNSCVATALGILNAKVGMIIQIIFVIETVINYFFEKKYDKYPFWLIILYIVIPTAILISTFSTVWDILPLISGIIFPIAILLRGFKLRFLNLVSVFLWIPYNFHFGAYVGAIGCIIFAIFNISAIIRLDLLKKSASDVE